jgi:hypothetical protein
MGDNQVKIVHSFGEWRPPVAGAKATQRVLHKGIRNLRRNHGNPSSRLVEFNLRSALFSDLQISITWELSPCQQLVRNSIFISQLFSFIYSHISRPFHALC